MGVTIISWLTYPCVYLIKTGLPGPTPTAEEQVGYSIADVVAKAVFGIMIWKVADTKSAVEEKLDMANLERMKVERTMIEARLSDSSRLGMCCAGDNGHPRMQRVFAK